MTLRMLLDRGKFHRIWPYCCSRTDTVYVTIGLARAYTSPICKLLSSKDYGESWVELADFYTMDQRITTTGQAFVTQNGVILVPVWNAGFYTEGITGVAIYRSGDGGSIWDKVYEDARGTYAKHFFEDSDDGTLYLGVGIEGGGRQGSISFRPAGAYLLKSCDSGRSWQKCLRVSFPTALYSGLVFDENKLIVTAREKDSIFRSVDGGRNWVEVPLGKRARCVAKIGEMIVVSSDSALFVSRDEGLTWSLHSSPIRNLFFRYPTSFGGRIIMTAGGWRSLVLATTKAMRDWSVVLDGTKVARGGTLIRMSLLDRYMFLGDEMSGVLLRLQVPTGEYFNANRYSIMSLIPQSLLGISRVRWLMEKLLSS